MLRLADILNYALTLEHLEDTFYRQGLAQFSQQQFADAGFDSDFYNNLNKIGQDESDHVNFLTTALKGALILAMQYEEHSNQLTPCLQVLVPLLLMPASTTLVTLMSRLSSRPPQSLRVLVFLLTLEPPPTS
jgi:hypothetical protein